MTLSCPRTLALAHLRLRMQPIVRALRIATAAREATALRLREAGAVAHAISRRHADALLDHLGEEAHADAPAPTADELAAERALRDQAAGQGARLPLDLFAELGLDAFELEVVALCAAVELDRDIERVIGYIHDDLGRRAVSGELAAGLTAGSIEERLARRAALGPFGRLRRLGIIACSAGESQLRDSLRLGPHAFDALLGAAIDLPLVFRDPGTVELVAPAAVPADTGLVAHAAEALAAGRLDVVALWGGPRATRDVVAALATKTGRPLRRHPAGGVDATTAATCAGVLGEVLWIDLDAIAGAPPPDLLDACVHTRTPLIVTGSHAWRPTDLIAARNVLEIPLSVLDHDARRTLWHDELPELGDRLDRVAAAFRFDAGEVRAAARMARTAAALRSNGQTISVGDALDDACFAVARKQGERNTTLVVPRRGPDDLILAPDLHERVLEIALDFQAMPQVMETWDFVRRVSGAGVKVMFAGDSGTGKTLAAEVVAGKIGLPMLKVDLAHVVSKWIGETEKNLDAVFTEARDSHAVLFFDEAEALFGARADVRHGTDRYANLEVSYLLQRLEDHSGVVILATNLRDKIDRAFMRRFHAVINFPRPAERERLRMWQRVFTPAIPLAADLDFPGLARLDLTGAGIVGAAQSAALLAAREAAAVTMRHIVRGLVRQFQRESRVLLAHELGAHAVHMAAPDGR